MVQMLFLVELYMPNMFYVDEHYKKNTAETCVMYFLLKWIISLNKMTAMNHDSNPN